MVNSCTVYGCTSNDKKKDKTNYIPIFTFPDDSEKRAEWIRNIPNTDLKVTNNSRVCINYFEERKNIKYECECSAIYDVESYDKSGFINIIGFTRYC